MEINLGLEKASRKPDIVCRGPAQLEIMLHRCLGPTPLIPPCTAIDAKYGCFFQWQWHNPQATGFFLPPWPTSLKSTARHLKESTCWMNQATGSTRGRCRLSSLARGVTKNRARMALTLGGVQVFVAFSVISIKPFRLPDYSA